MTKRVRLLYVVARDRPDLKERLTAAFLDTDNVEVIVDRRTTRTADRGSQVDRERRVMDRDSDLAARPVRVGGQDVGLDHVLDLGEVARLRAVTVDLHGPAFERGQNELRNDGRVLRRRVLTRPEDVEVAQADGLHAIEAIPHGRVFLAGQLGDAIG